MRWILRFGFCLGLSATAWLPGCAQGGAALLGDGLLGAYYQGRNFEAFRHRQVDATINFYRRRQPPAEGVPAEDFSARWTGWLRVPTSGRYVLYLDVDDGARLWLDGRLLLDEWRGQPLSSYTLALDLQAGRAYALRLDYCQYGADAYAQLAWVRPEQLAQFQRAASWRTLWGLAAARPLRTVIPSRYLFSHNPAAPPRPARRAPELPRSQLPSALPAPGPRPAPWPTAGRPAGGKVWRLRPFVQRCPLPPLLPWRAAAPGWLVSWQVARRWPCRPYILPRAKPTCCRPRVVASIRWLPHCASSRVCACKCKGTRTTRGIRPSIASSRSSAPR